MFVAAEINEDDVDEEDMSQIASSLPHDLAHVPLSTYKRYSEKEMIERSAEFFDNMNNRRTLRYYSSEPVPKEVIENIVKTGGTRN